jgi:hypothetical protein
MFGLFKKAPKLEMAFTPKDRVARELAKEVEVAGELVVKNVGKDAELDGAARWCSSPAARAHRSRAATGLAGHTAHSRVGELRASVAWTVKLAAPMRAPAAEIQLNTSAGGKARAARPLRTKFPLDNA